MACIYHCVQKVRTELSRTTWRVLALMAKRRFAEASTACEVYGVRKVSWLCFTEGGGRGGTYEDGSNGAYGLARRPACVPRRCVRGRLFAGKGTGAQATDVTQVTQRKA